MKNVAHAILSLLSGILLTACATHSPSPPKESIAIGDLRPRLSALETGMSREEVFRILKVQMVPEVGTMDWVIYTYPFGRSGHRLSITFLKSGGLDTFDHATIWAQNRIEETWPKGPNQPVERMRSTPSSDDDRID